MSATDRLVEAEFRLAGVTAGVDVERIDVLLGAVDRAQFVDDDGEVDVERIGTMIEAIASVAAVAAPPPFPDLGQGARGDGNGNAPGWRAPDQLLSDIERAVGIFR